MASELQIGTWPLIVVAAFAFAGLFLLAWLNVRQSNAHARSEKELLAGNERLARKVMSLSANNQAVHLAGYETKLDAEAEENVAVTRMQEMQAMKPSRMASGV